MPPVPPFQIRAKALRCYGPLVLEEDGPSWMENGNFRQPLPSQLARQLLNSRVDLRPPMRCCQRGLRVFSSSVKTNALHQRDSSVPRSFCIHPELHRFANRLKRSVRSHSRELVPEIQLQLGDCVFLPLRSLLVLKIMKQDT